MWCWRTKQACFNACTFVFIVRLFLAFSMRDLLYLWIDDGRCFGIGVTMSVYDQRLAALEKDAATMKQDIIYKLDDTNSAVTIIRGLVEIQQQDIRDIKSNIRDIRSDVRDIRSDVRTVNVRLEGTDIRLEGMKEEIRAAKDQQDRQGQDIVDIKRHLDALDTTMATKEGVAALEKQMLDAFQQLLTVIDQRLPPLEK